MLIDSRTGAIHVYQDCVIEPTLCRSVFLSSVAGRSAGAHPPRGTSFRYDLFTGFPSSKQLYVTLHFESERLRDAEIMLALEGEGSSWDDWSIDHEMHRKSLHDSLLQSDLSDPIREGMDLADQPWERYQAKRYKFEWGRVLSFYSSQSANSIIFIDYANKSQILTGWAKLLNVLFTGSAPAGKTGTR